MRQEHAESFALLLTAVAHGFQASCCAGENIVEMNDVLLRFGWPDRVPSPGKSRYMLGRPRGTFFHTIESAAHKVLLVELCIVPCAGREWNGFHCVRMGRGDDKRDSAQLDGWGCLVDIRRGRRRGNSMSRDDSVRR